MFYLDSDIVIGRSESQPDVIKILIRAEASLPVDEAKKLQDNLLNLNIPELTAEQLAILIAAAVGKQKLQSVIEILQKRIENASSI